MHPQTFNAKLVLKRKKSGNFVSGIVLFYHQAEKRISLREAAKNFTKAFAHLSAVEQKHVQSFKHKQRRTQFVWGRIALKLALVTVLSQDESSFLANFDKQNFVALFRSLTMESGVFPYPYLSHVDKTFFSSQNKVDDLPSHHFNHNFLAKNFSLSHTHHYTAAISFPSGHPMAIDITELNNNKEVAQRRILTASEQKFAISYSKQENQALINFLWSCHEALAKTIGMGFTTSHHLYEVANLKKMNIQKMNTHKTVALQGIQLYEVSFKHFFQLKAIGLVNDRIALTLCVPKKTEIVFPKELFDFLATSDKNSG